MPKKSRQKFKYLENGKSFKDEIKSIFHHFWRAIIKANKEENFGRWESNFKLAIILCLVSGAQPMQTIYLIDLKDIKYVGEQVFIPIMQKIKQGKPGNHIYPFNFKTYPKKHKTRCCCSLEKIYWKHKLWSHLIKFLLATQNLIKP